MTDLWQAASAAAAKYRYPEYRRDVEITIWAGLADGLSLEAATREAFKWANRQAVEDGHSSLDALQSVCGDALRVDSLPCPAPTRRARSNRERRAGGKATARAPEKGIGEEGCDLMHLITVLRNLVDRNVLECDPLTCAVDVRALEPVLRRATEMILQSATRRELREAGITPALERAAVRAIDARLRLDLV